jgi:hypothetical protein
MDVSDFSQYTNLSIEAAAAFLLCVVGWKLYKMRIHTRSGCCDGVLVETMSRADSNHDLEFSTIGDDRKKPQHESIMQ